MSSKLPAFTPDHHALTPISRLDVKSQQTVIFCYESPDRHGSDTLTATLFLDVLAKAKRNFRGTVDELAETIDTVSATAKNRLPLLKLATFGDQWTNRGSLRSDGNVTAVTGLELDFDGGLGFDKVSARLATTGILALVHTSPSHTDDAPRLRVLCPFSQPYAPAMRNVFMGRLNALFPDEFAPESWILSQTYFYGRIGENPGHRVEIINGQHVDLMNWLPALGRSAPTMPQSQQQPDQCLLSERVYSGPATMSRERFDRYAQPILDRLGNAADGQKLIQARRAAYSLGGVQVAAQVSDTEICRLIWNALPASKKSEKRCNDAVQWALAKGRAKPFDVERDHPALRGVR